MPETLSENTFSDSLASSQIASSETVYRVLVCQHQSCLRNGAAETLKAFQALINPGFEVECSGCMGQCNIGPSVRILPDETWYAWVQPSDVPTIVQQHLKEGKLVQEKLNPRIHPKFSW
ncbi:MAG: (2Fe-2S) ferredoxin domain-containing protein [Microcoleaceae cyanobacterium]